MVRLTVLFSIVLRINIKIVELLAAQFLSEFDSSQAICDGMARMASAIRVAKPPQRHTKFRRNGLRISVPTGCVKRAGGVRCVWATAQSSVCRRAGGVSGSQHL